MSDAQTTEVVIRRTPSLTNHRELERRSRPESAHKGNLKRLKTSSVSGFQRWEKENELLWAMLEDETEWLSQLFPDIIITPELFFYALEDGVVLCRLANLIQEKADEYGEKNNVNVSGRRFKYHKSIAKKNKQLALFKSRENVQGFLTWCRQLGISDSILFESNDIVEADECREGCREVVICLMEIARRASGRYKFIPIPKLIQLEKEIEAEEQQDAEKNELDQIDYGSSDEESTDSGTSAGHSPPGLENSSPVTDSGNDRRATSGRGKRKPKKQLPKSELDKEVSKIIDNFNLYNIRKIKEGKYLILGKIMFVRMLNAHVLLRIGGGWDTLEHYLMTHIPKAAQENGDTSSEHTVCPSVSKSPQKSQLTKLLGKVKKEQQFKATPASSPYYSPAASKSAKKQDDSSEDEKDITSAIRKIEFSVNQNIATRRKHSRVSVEETLPQKASLTCTESNKNTADFNQNNIATEPKTSKALLNEFPQGNPTCEHIIFTKKMEDETCRTESGFLEEINGDDDATVGSIQQNGGEKLISFEGSSETESFNISEPLKKAAEEEIMEQDKDVVDGASLADIATETTSPDAESQDIEVITFEPEEDAGEDAREDAGEAPPEAEPIANVNSGTLPTSHEEDQTVQEIGQTDSFYAHMKDLEESSALEQLSENETLTECTDIHPSSVDDPVDVTNNSDKSTPAISEVPDSDKSPSAFEVPVSEIPVSDAPISDAPISEIAVSEISISEPPISEAPFSEIPVSEISISEVPAAEVTVPLPAGSASPDARKGSPVSPEKKVAESPKKKVPAKNSKEPLNKKQTSAKSTVPKKGTAASTAGRTKTTHSKMSGRPPTEGTTVKNSKRPTSAVKTTPSTKTSERSSGGSNTITKTTSPTAHSKNPATKSEPKPASRPTRPVKTTAFGSTISKPPAKKPLDSSRPSTAPPGRATQARGKPVASKVQTGLSSSRPQSARPKTASTEGKDATDGGASSKGTGKPTKNVNTARATSPTKPLVRKTQTKTVTTLKTTRPGDDGKPEVSSQTIKTTKTVTEANGKKTTKTTMKELAPPIGRKPLRMTKTETTETRKAPTKKNETGKPEPKTGANKPDAKSKVGGTTRGGSADTKKGTKATKKATTKSGVVKSEQEFDSHLKGTIPKAKTVKELPNALGIAKPGAVAKITVATVETEAKLTEELKIETTAQEEAKDVVSNPVQDLSDKDVGSKDGEVEEKEDEKVVEEDKDVKKEKEEEPEEDIAVKNGNERLAGKQDELVHVSEKPGLEEDEGFVEKEVETGERLEDLITEKSNEGDADKIPEQDGGEIPENDEIVKEEKSEENDKQFDDQTTMDTGGIIEYSIPVEWPGSMYTENIVTSERGDLPETNGELDEESEIPKQDEEMFEDSIELDQAVTDQVLFEETKREVTEAWQAIDERKEHGSSEETDGERQDEVAVDLIENDQDLLLAEESRVDPWDPVSHQALVDPPPSVAIDTERFGEYNNNVAEYSVGALLETERPSNPDVVPACAHPGGAVILENTSADLIHEGASVLEAGDKNTDLFQFDDAAENGEPAQMEFQELCTSQGNDVLPKEGNDGGTFTTVDDLLN